MKTPQSFKKLGMFTDIHLGRRNNSRVHNQDCLDFIDWFCHQVISAKDYSHICFLGDWFESRSAINIETFEYSYIALKKLNDLELPIYFIVGNHDLHRRTTRDVHSVRMFNELSNITVIDKPTVIDEILFCPFLFEDEYPALVKHLDLWAFIGHFEFKDFVVTGSGYLMDHGPSHIVFAGPKKIFSGHFHKRQSQDNVHYIGNAFPMDFGDAGDYERGMATYYVADDKLKFTNWSNCPKYYKTTLSKVIEERWTPLPRMKVKCVIDTEVGYQDAQDLREAMIKAHGLRDFVLEEDRAVIQGLHEGEGVKVTESMLNFTSIDDLVIQQLAAVKDDKKTNINAEMLIEIYKTLPAETTEKEE